MQDQLYDLLGRPSRWVGWGVVVLIHVLMWLVLSHGLDIRRIAPVLEAIQVSLLDNEPAPPEAPPQLPVVPKLEVPATSELFVPTPEVSVVQESTMKVSITPVPPSAATETPAAVSASYSPPRLAVISVSEVNYLKEPEVRFPPAAKRAKEHGMVLLSVVVDEHGRVHRISIFKTSGYQRLDDAAVKAVRFARFRPYTRNGMAIPIEVRIPVEFPLERSV